MTNLWFLVGDSHLTNTLGKRLSEGAHSLFQQPCLLMVIFGASGVTITQSAEKAAKCSGEDILASKKLEQPAIVMSPSGKDLQRIAKISASVQISAEATRSRSPLEADSNTTTKGKQRYQQPLKGQTCTCKVPT